MLLFVQFFECITVDPDARASSHGWNTNKTQFFIMHLLCKTYSIEETAELEKKLVIEFRSQHKINRGPGGEGVKYPVNYIYIML
jgi:hypothetical protein